MSRILKQRKVIIGAIAGIVVLGFILPTQQVHAALFGVESFTSRAILGMLYYTLDAIFGVIGYSVGVMAKLINVAVKVRAGGEIPVVKATWEILRDFSNMLFIIILIYMAFATIFNWTNYTFQKMIVRFVIVAVLINFSMAIGNLIIDGTQVLSNVFLSSIGDLGNRLGEYMDPQKLIPSNVGAGDLTIASLASLVFAVVLGGIFFFSLLVAAVFSIVRVPIIWGLLIISPLIWMAYILPGTQKAYWSWWWNQFFGWNLFLPVYLFFMYLGLFFLSQRDQIIEAVVVTNSSGANPANSPLLGGLESSLTFNLIFFYLFTAFIMIGGTTAAVKVTSMMGGGFERGFGWARGMVGRITRFDAAKGAYEQRKDQFKQEGFKREGLINRWTGGGAQWMYGGKEADQRRQARYAEILGVRGAQFKNAKEFVSAVDKETTSLRDQERAGKIQVNDEFKAAAARESNMSPRGLAMRSLLYERGMIDSNEFAKDMKTWTSQNPFLAESMIKKAQKGGFKSVPANQLLEMASAQGTYTYLNNASGSGARRDFFNALIGDKDLKGVDQALSSMTLPQLKEAVGLMGGHDSNESGKFRRELAKKRPDLIGEYEWERAQAEGLPATRAEKTYDVIKDKKGSDLAEALQTTWTNPVFQEALRLRIQVQDSAVPPVEAGTFVPNTVPAGTLPPALLAVGVAQTPMPGGTVYHVKWPTGVPKPPGIKTYKGRPGGGEAFKSSLEKATSTNVAKNQIAATL